MTEKYNEEVFSTTVGDLLIRTRFSNPEDCWVTEAVNTAKKGFQEFRLLCSGASTWGAGGLQHQRAVNTAATMETPLSTVTVNTPVSTDQPRIVLTPNDVDVLLHCFCSRAPHPRIHAPAVKSAHDYFVQVGAIESLQTEAGYRTTPLGAAWVTAICRVPVPKSVFVDENGEVIS